MDWNRALFDGMLISVFICGWISVILKINPRYEMKSYPPEIVRIVEKQTKLEKKGFLIMALPMLLIMIAYIIFTLVSTYSNINVTFLTLFLHSFVALMVWNIIDLLIFDWMIFCKINPNFMIMPGTKGNPAYKDYKYHFIGFLKGCIMSIIAALMISGIVKLIQIFI